MINSRSSSVLSTNSKVLLLDIEIAPSVGYTWGPKFDTSIIEFIEPWYILSVAYKWLGGPTKVVALDTMGEKQLLQRIHKVLNECDVAVAHNGDKFDFKKLNTRFLHFGIKPPSPYQTIDTRKIARQMFGFYSNSLNDLCKEFGLGEKVHHEGFPLWKKCMGGDKKAFRVMKKYNINDVDLLEKIYLRFRPWSKSHPQVSHGENCSRCGSPNTISMGTRRNRTSVRRRFQCKDCGGWMSSVIGERVSNLSPS